MSKPGLLRTRAEALAAPLPALLARAEHLAASVILGDHGRRRAGQGDAFWQYRPAMTSDEARRIDWRRSARSDATFVQEKEWQIAQSVSLWVDCAASMRFASARGLPDKADRAGLLALALAIVLLRGGERVGLIASARQRGGQPPRRGSGQAGVLAGQLGEALAADAPDYGAVSLDGVAGHGRVVLVSDFLGDVDTLETVVLRATDRGISGALVQVLDPSEQEFPYDGRTIFESVGGSLRHETLKAGDLRARYRQRLAERQERLRDLSRRTGWHVTQHRTCDPALPALTWLYGIFERRR